MKIHKKKLLIPTYHTVSDRRIPHVINLFPYRSLKQFEMDMDFLTYHFTPISLSALINSLHGDTVLPDKSFLLTFDDGYREVVEIIAPILNRRSIPAVLFLNSATIDNKELLFRNKTSLIVERLENSINPSVLDKLSAIFQLQVPTLKNTKTAILGVNYQNRHLLDEAAKVLGIDFNEYLLDEKPYLTSEEVRSLIDKGFMIGAHSIDHPRFSDIQFNEQMTQALVSLGKLKEQFALTYNAFAFPFNDTGVTKEFFDQTHYSGVIDISFGTSGFAKGHSVNNLQRQLMEYGGRQAKTIYQRLLTQEALTIVKHKLRLEVF